MRAIKFRGKRLDNGEWVYGCYSYLKPPLSETLVHYIIKDGFTPVEVDPDTVGQYTGLKDRNGNEIFEGDFLQYDNERYQVYWSEDWAMYAVKGCQLQALMRYADYGEVIGNKYDNPELLEQ